MIAPVADQILPVPAGSDHSGATVICFSHLRWGFVFQRPQHLMSRFAAAGRVVFWEEPEYGSEGAPRLNIDRNSPSGVVVVTPQLPHGLSVEAERAMLKRLLDGLVAGESAPIVRWYYTPMMLPFSEHVEAQ